MLQDYYGSPILRSLRCLLKTRNQTDLSHFVFISHVWQQPTSDRLPSLVLQDYYGSPILRSLRCLLKTRNQTDLSHFVFISRVWQQRTSDRFPSLVLKKRYEIRRICPISYLFPTSGSNRQVTDFLFPVIKKNYEFKQICPIS